MLRELIEQHRVTPEQIARLTQSHPATVRRWIRENKAPAAVLKLIEITAGGTLPTTCESWKGWTIHGRWLVDPDGLCYEAHEIKARWLLYQMTAEIRRQAATPHQYRLF